jgi:hypothetical protein
VSLARGTRGCPGLKENLFLFADVAISYFEEDRDPDKAMFVLQAIH